VIGVAGGLLLAQASAAVFAQLRYLIAIVVISMFLSFAMEPAVQWLARRGIRRGAGTGIVFVAVIVTLTGFVAAMLPMMVDQVTNLIARHPGCCGRSPHWPSGCPARPARPWRRGSTRPAANCPPGPTRSRGSSGAARSASARACSVGCSGWPRSGS
jgi:hypothetical protein